MPDLIRRRCCNLSYRHTPRENLQLLLGRVGLTPPVASSACCLHPIVLGGQDLLLFSLCVLKSNSDGYLSSQELGQRLKLNPEKLTIRTAGERTWLQLTSEQSISLSVSFKIISIGVGQILRAETGRS